LAASVSRTAATTAAVGSMVAASVAGGEAATAVTSGTEATAATVNAMAAGVVARTTTANGMAEAAEVGAAETTGGKAGAKPAPKAACGTAEHGPGATAEETAGTAAGVRPPCPAEWETSGLRIARTVEPTNVAATAQQGAVTPGAQSDRRAAAETVVEGSKDWQMGNAGAEAAVAAAGGVAEDGPGATEAEAESVTDGAPNGERPKPAKWGNMTATQRRNWRKRGGVVPSPWYPKGTQRFAPWYLPSQKARETGKYGQRGTEGY